MRTRTNKREDVTIRLIEAEAWRLYFTIGKSLLLVVTSVVYFVFLIVFFLARSGFSVAEKSLISVRRWKPVKPAIFKSAREIELEAGREME